MRASLVCLLLVLLGCSDGQEFDSPCPEVYEVLNDDVEWHGILQVPAKFFNNQCMWVEMVFYTNKEIKMSNKGWIELMGSREKTLEKILSKKHLKYKIHFPNQAVVPQVLSIKLNNFEICMGSEKTPQENYLSLKHFLYIGSFNEDHQCKTDYNNRNNGFYWNKNGTYLNFEKLKEESKAQSQIPANKKNISKSEINQICGQSVNRVGLNPGLTEPKDWPWLVAIYLKKMGGLQFLCTGTLISNKHIVTAAHCVNEKGNLPLTTSEVLIKLGEYSLQDWSNFEAKISPLQRFHFYPKYDGNLGFFHDLVILEINYIEFSDSIRPICLPIMFEKENFPSTYVNFMAVGWKHDSKMQLDTPIPQQMVSTTVENYQCANRNAYFRIIMTEDMICTENYDGNKVQSYGNGLYTLKNGKWFLNGILSFHLKNTTNYEIHVNTDHYNYWMNEVMFDRQ